MNMRRIKDTFLTSIQSVISFEDRDVLEIGCGDGTRSIQIATACKQLTALELDAARIEHAKAINIARNISYLTGTASQLPFLDQTFDIVFFTLSLHHIPDHEMSVAIDEAVRVTKPNGHIVFLEPAFEGSFFEGEIRFDACDGDERRQKAIAYAAMLGHTQLKELAELHDETIFSFDSLEDFMETMKPKRGSPYEIQQFLTANQFTLSARRRINIFKPQTK